MHIQRDDSDVPDGQDRVTNDGDGGRREVGSVFGELEREEVGEDRSGDGNTCERKNLKVQIGEESKGGRNVLNQPTEGEERRRKGQLASFVLLYFYQRSRLTDSPDEGDEVDHSNSSRDQSGLLLELDLSRDHD